MHKSQYYGTGFSEKEERYCEVDCQGDRYEGLALVDPTDEEEPWIQRDDDKQ